MDTLLALIAGLINYDAIVRTAADNEVRVRVAFDIDNGVRTNGVAFVYSAPVGSAGVTMNLRKFALEDWTEAETYFLELVERFDGPSSFQAPRIHRREVA